MFQIHITNNKLDALCGYQLDPSDTSIDSEAYIQVLLDYGESGVTRMVNDETGGAAQLCEQCELDCLYNAGFEPRRRSTFVVPYPKPKLKPIPYNHILFQGATLCGRTDPPSSWPENERWVSLQDYDIEDNLSQSRRGIFCPFCEQQAQNTHILKFGVPLCYIGQTLSNKGKWIDYDTYITGNFPVIITICRFCSSISKNLKKEKIEEKHIVSFGAALCDSTTFNPNTESYMPVETFLRGLREIGGGGYLNRLASSRPGLICRQCENVFYENKEELLMAYESEDKPKKKKVFKMDYPTYDDSEGRGNPAEWRQASTSKLAGSIKPPEDVRKDRAKVNEREEPEKPKAKRSIRFDE